MQWWYVKNGERHGPVEESELKAMAADGRLKRDDLIWNSTMGSEWQKAGDVPGIFAAETPAASMSGSQAGSSRGAAAPKSELREAYSPQSVSVSNPVDAAWIGTKKILFKPFDIGKWFALGFSAWLATLLEGGGVGNFNPGGSGKDSGNVGNGFANIFSSAKNAWNEMQGVVLAAIIALILIGFVVGIVLMWARSRGKFMFLDNVVNNTDKVKEPWTEFQQHGNSLFKWMLVFSIVMFLVFLVLAGSAFVGIILPCIRAEQFISSTIPVIVIIGIIWLLIAIVSAYIMRFLEDFIVPIMYKKDMTVTEAWSYFGSIYRDNTGRLIGYGLFYFLLTLGAGMVVMLATVLTCCILGCVAAIPYVGTVALLPVPVFFRLYSIHYIAQYGPDTDLVTGAPCTAAVEPIQTA